MPDSSQLIKEPAVFTLEDEELANVTDLVERLVTAFPTAGGIEYLRAATLQSHHLPERLLEFLLGIRSRETAAAFVVSGFTARLFQDRLNPVELRRCPGCRDVITLRRFWAGR